MMGWPGPDTDLQVAVWMAHFEWRYKPPGADLSMDGLVPEETQRRWADKVAGAKYTMPERLRERAEAAAKAEREIRRQREEARQRAEAQGRSKA